MPLGQQLAILIALATAFAAVLNAWRQSAYPDETPKWIVRTLLAMVFGFAICFLAAALSIFGLLNLSALQPYLWYALLIAFAAAAGLVLYSSRHRIRSRLRAYLVDEDAPSGRISFLRFKEIAEKEYGWNFGPQSSQLLDFANGVRQGGLDKAFVVEGRPDCHNVGEHMKLNYLLEPIHDLNEWWIGVLQDDNWDIETYRFDDPDYHRKNHRDIHIDNEAAARRWLAHDGKSFKTVQPTVTAEKALIHIAHHSSVNDRIRAKMEFERAARHGHLKVWGQSVVTQFGDKRVAAMDAIRRDYWADAELDLATFILYEKSRAFPDQYNHENKTTQGTRQKEGSSRRIDLEVNLHVNADQVLSIWPKTRKGSPLEATSVAAAKG